LRLVGTTSWETALSKPRIDSRLSGAQFTRGMLADLEKQEVLNQFGGQGLITDVEGIIGDGKEATVYACRAHESVGVEWLAAKVYRARKFRAFTGARVYAGDRAVMGPGTGRAKRAMRKDTKVGRALAHKEWISWEWETLCKLYDAGADVPEPLARSEDAILMELAADEHGPAPKLRQVALEPDAAREVFERLKRNVEILLDCHLVHGDLSAYNVLYAAGRPWVIDVPQSVDLFHRADGREYLFRDVANLGRYFAKYGLEMGDFAERAWARYQRGQLGR
jgi:RIO kinase 1